MNDNDNERILLVKKVFEERLQSYTNSRRDLMQNGVRVPRDIEIEFTKRLDAVNARIAECLDVLAWIAARPAGGEQA